MNPWPLYTRRPSHFLLSCPLLMSIIFTFSSLFSVLLKRQWVVVAHTVLCVNPQCIQSADWKQTVCETTIGCMSVSEGSQSRPALPSTVHPHPPSKPPFTPIPTLPIAHKPCQSTVSTLQMLVCQLLLPILSKMALQQQYYTSTSLPLSQLSLHTTMQMIFFSSLFWNVSSYLLKWSQHIFCAVSLKAKMLKAPPKCWTYKNAQGHVVFSHVSVSMVTLFSPKPLVLLQTQKIQKMF